MKPIRTLIPPILGETCCSNRVTRLALVQQVVVQLAIAVHLATIFPWLADQLGLADVVARPPAQRGLQPGIEAARADAQVPTHRPHLISRPMVDDERVSHFASLAKYAVAFFRMSRSSVTRRSSRFWRGSRSLLRLARDRLRELPFPCTTGVLTDAQPLRKLRNRIASLGDLRHRVSIKIVAELRFTHLSLLASNLGKKASTNLGAIQCDYLRNMQKGELGWQRA